MRQSVQDAEEIGDGTHLQEIAGLGPGVVWPSDPGQMGALG